jgi:hypothetical protein
MESMLILLPFLTLFIIQSSCIVCIHRRVKRLETIPIQTWIPQPTPQWQPPPSAPQDWRDSVI